MSSVLKKFGFMILENQSFMVSTVNFSSAENSSARDVDFSHGNTAEVASIS